MTSKKNNKEKQEKKEKKERVALVHDFLLYYGGAEETLRAIGGIYPKADIFTLLKDDTVVREYFSDFQVQASFLEKWPKFLKKRHRFLLPFMPTAPETFNLRDYDVVISSSSAFAKGVVLKPKTTHICYTHAPMRYVWDWNHEYLEEKKLKGKSKLFTRFLLNYLRTWDRASAERVDYFVANSHYTAKRIWKYYRKQSTVIYPPVDVRRFSAEKRHRDYFLTVSRLSPYKRVDLIIEAFKKLKLPLIVVGEGAEKQRLIELAKGEKLIKIKGFVKEQELTELYQNARAFVSATEDDFNISVVEAMAAGKPVIALEKGGVKETVIEGVTGKFFKEAKLELIADGVRRFIQEEDVFDAEKIRDRAREFSKERFQRELSDFVKKVMGNKKELPIFNSSNQ